MSKAGDRKKHIIFLSHVHNVFLFPCVLISLCGKRWTFLFMGLCFLIKAVWNIVGYKLRWKHVGCSFQLNRRYTVANPDNINWSLLRNGIRNSIVLDLVCGIGLVIYEFYALRFI